MRLASRRPSLAFRRALALGLTLLAPALLACERSGTVTPDDPGKATDQGSHAKPDATSPVAPPKALHTVEGITEYALANGMRVLLFPDPSRERVTVNITYLVGSRHEGYGETGMAHLLEHMLFKGSSRHKDLLTEFSQHGAVWNAETNFDYTSYYQTMLSTPENLRFARPGGGEVARFIGRHGTKRIARAVLVGAVPPLMLRTAANPEGLPVEVFDGIRKGVAADRSQFFKDLAVPFYGANRDGAEVSQGLRDSFWLQGMMGGLKPLLDCIKAFSETDFTEDLKKFDIPTLLIHGDDDQIVPIGASAQRSVKLVKGATLKVYPKGSHGLASIQKDQLNTDLLTFIKG